MEHIVKSGEWACKDHNQEEWHCVQDGDRFYHMKRYKGFEQKELGNSFIGEAKWVIPEGSFYLQDKPIDEFLKSKTKE